MKNLFLTFVLFLSALAAQAQVVAVVDYMKVPENKDADYLAVEKQWKTLHQSNVQSGKILGWNLFYIRNTGTGSPYNYATVAVYENFSKSGGGFTEEEFRKAFGAKSDELIQKTIASRDLVCSETYHLQSTIGEDVPSKYIVVNWVKTDDLGRYIQMENEAFKPLHELAKKAGKRNSWELWTQWPYNDHTVQAVVVDGFSKFQDINNTDYMALYEQYIAGKKANEIYDMTEKFSKMGDIRTIVRSEIWEYVDGTTPKTN